MRELSEKATQAAAGAWDQAHELVSELVERGKELDVPERVERVAGAIREPAQHAIEAVREPAERAAVEVRRRRWTLLAGIAAAVMVVVIGRVCWQRRAQRRQLARHEGGSDPFGPDARYQERAVSAAS